MSQDNDNDQDQQWHHLESQSWDWIKKGLLFISGISLFMLLWREGPSAFAYMRLAVFGSISLGAVYIAFKNEIHDWYKANEHIFVIGAIGHFFRGLSGAISSLVIAKFCSDRVDVVKETAKSADNALPERPTLSTFTAYLPSWDGVTSHIGKLIEKDPDDTYYPTPMDYM